MTNFVGLGHLTAVKTLILGAILLLAGGVQARPPVPGGGSSYYDLIYVQAPNLSSNQPHMHQPVITPNQIGEAELDQVGHLWPRMVSYSMETDAVEAFVQPNLKVGMQYNYSFNFELSVRSGQGRGMPIPDGWYQLQIAIIKKSGQGRVKLNPFERYVTSNSMFLKISNGSFGRKIALRFPDVTSTSLKHHLFVELIPLKEECINGEEKIRCINVNARGEPDATRSILEPRPGIKTYLVEMPFIPYYPTGGKVRDADDLSAEDQAFLGGSLAKYIARSQLYRNKAALQKQESSSPREHAAKNKLNLLSVNDPSLADISSAIKTLLDTRSIGTAKLQENQKFILQTLCAQLIANQAEFQQRHRELPMRSSREKVIQTHIGWCAKDPATYMRLNRVVHVGRPVAGKVERLAQKSLNYTLMSNYMSSRSHSQDTSTTVTLKTPSILVQFIDQIGLGVGHSVSFSNGRSKAETGIASMSTSLDFNYVVFNVPTVGSQQCLEVRALPDQYGFFYDRTAGAKNGLYICDDKDDKVMMNPEVYAHAFERCKDTTMMECDTLSQSVNVSLRGERELSAFFYAIRGGISPDHNNRVMPFGNVENAEKYFANVPLMDDMEIITPVEFPQEKVPSFIKQITFQHREIFN